MGACVETATRLGRYRLLDRIGGGATSVVYSAHDEGADRDVAIKMIAADLADEREARDRFYREVMVTSGIHHRNIVAVLDVGEDQGRAYLVMELLRGRSLRDYLRIEAPPTLGARLDLIVQLYDGLAAAHEQGVVHRDIKPSNLFVQDDGGLKILDFGLARLQTSTLTASGQIVGTPDFMSPEQAEGQRVDARSDIFSAAAVSYLILSGRSPFARRNLQETLIALVQANAEPLSGEQAPAELRAIVAKGLSRAVDDRYQSCAAVLADLRRVQHGMPS